MFSAAYHDSTLPFLIYLTVLPARIVVWGAAMMALGMSREMLLRSMFDLAINAVFCLVFVELLGYVGAAMALAVSRLVALRRCAPRRRCTARCAAQRGAPTQEAPPNNNAARPGGLSGPEVQRRVRAAWQGPGDLRNAVRLLPRDAAALVDAELTKCVHTPRAMDASEPRSPLRATRRVALTARFLQVRRAAQPEYALATGAADAASDAHAGGGGTGGGGGACAAGERRRH
jgi:hypothetical protein